MKSTIAAFKRECAPGRKAVLFFPGKAPQERTVHAVRTANVVFTTPIGTYSFLTVKGARVEVEGARWTISFSDSPITLAYTFSHE